MRKQILAFFNKLVGAYNDPFYEERTPDIVTESFARSAKFGKLAAGAYECDLYHLGTFDDVTGELSLLQKPRLLLNLSVLKPEKEVKDGTGKETAGKEGQETV